MTRQLLVASVIMLALIDVMLLIRGGVDATFSRVILDESHNHPIIPFAAGVICGHLFWPQRAGR